MADTPDRDIEIVARLDTKMIEEVFAEWERENPGKPSTPEGGLTAEIFAERLMAKMFRQNGPRQ